MAIKKAQVLTNEQFRSLEPIVRASSSPLRDEAALRLSYFAGLRAGEIAKLRWATNVLDVSGKVRNTLAITSDVGKRSVVRDIPLDPDTRAILTKLRKERPDDVFVFHALHNYNPPQEVIIDASNLKPVTVPGMVRNKVTGVMEAGQVPVKKIAEDFKPGQVTPNAVVQWFKRLYAQASMEGASSHSGRRTFITSRARLANLKGCSIKDVQMLAGHKRLDTTAGYIEPSNQQRELVAATGW